MKCPFPNVFESHHTHTMYIQQFTHRAQPHMDSRQVHLEEENMKNFETVEIFTTIIDHHDTPESRNSLIHVFIVIIKAVDIFVSNLPPGHSVNHLSNQIVMQMSHS